MQRYTPITIPRYWKWLAVVIPFVVGLLFVVGVWTLLWRVGESACQSEAHLSDLCDPYLPGVPGKEGR